jgi:hypothetical protein
MGIKNKAMSHSNGEGLMPYIVKKTSKSLGFEFNPDTKTISLKGKSIPENHASFFEPILTWLDGFISHPPSHTQVVIKLDYFNTSSSKYLLKIFKKFEAIPERGAKVMIHWIYEQDDWDMRDCGLDYKEIVKIPFKLIEIEETA